MILKLHVFEYWIRIFKLEWNSNFDRIKLEVCKDLQEEYRNREASAPSQPKPKSLWEELVVIFCLN
ncbi:hypothetical protein HanPSC8_Chr03g0118131 [Helianthus annuus]|nr:hypothetical protein HanPSC8_Chr03g0118131 [Helianthus annuus]